MYSDRTEPLVLLYNGEGLSKLQGSAMGGESGSSKTSHLPDNSILQQNSPNPASKSTRITYTLPDASSQTAVRIFNTHGEVVMELKEGAKEAGEHQVALDLSSLPSGSYVYQVAAHLPAGERVSAKVMQVAK
jgi:flagellar hook assembly protein FlgD